MHKKHFLSSSFPIASSILVMTNQSSEPSKKLSLTFYISQKLKGSMSKKSRNFWSCVQEAQIAVAFRLLNNCIKYATGTSRNCKLLSACHLIQKTNVKKTSWNIGPVNCKKILDSCKNWRWIFTYYCISLSNFFKHGTVKCYRIYFITIKNLVSLHGFSLWGCDISGVLHSNIYILSGNIINIV